MNPAENAARIIEEMADECCNPLPPDPFERRVALAAKVGGLTSQVQHLARLFGMDDVVERIKAHRRPEDTLERAYAYARVSDRRKEAP